MSEQEIERRIFDVLQWRTFDGAAAELRRLYAIEGRVTELEKRNHALALSVSKAQGLAAEAERKPAPPPYLTLTTDELLARLHAAYIETRLDPWAENDVQATLIIAGNGATAHGALLDALATMQKAVEV